MQIKYMPYKTIKARRKKGAPDYHRVFVYQALAELNTKFFQKKFNLLLSGEQLAEYSEEERRLLYMDFRLDQRRVELGFCMKKMAEGGCNLRNSRYNCVSYRNLCTGEKYLSYWLELLESQVMTVQVMEEKYQMAGITEYQSFKEYERAVFLRFRTKINI